MGKLLHIPNPLMPLTDIRTADAVEGMSVTDILEREDWSLPPTTILVRRVGDDWKPVKRVDWDNLPIGTNEEAALVTVPRGGDNGGSAVIGILAAIALSIIAPGIGTFIAGTLFGLTGTLATIVGGLITAAIVVGGQYLISSLLPKPKPPNEGPAASPTYALSAQSNQARLGQPIPEIFGKWCTFPDLAAKPYFDFAHNKQHIYELFSIGVGHYELEQIRIANTVIWNKDTGYTNSYGGEFRHELIGPGEKVTLFADNVFPSTEVSSITLPGTNDPNYKRIGPFVCNPAGTVAHRLSFDMVMPGGCFSVDSHGNLQSANANFEAWIQLIDDSEKPLGDWFLATSDAISLATRTAWRDSYDVDLDVPGRYRAYQKRTNDKSTDLNTSDELVWLSMRAYLPNTKTFDDVTTLAIQAEATDQLNGTSAQQINVVVTRKLPLYDPETGHFGDLQPTQAIDAAAAYVLRSFNGGNQNDNSINLDVLAQIADTWTDRGDTFNGSYDSPTGVWAALEEILHAGRAFPILSPPMVTFVRDEPKTVYRASFQPRNMLPNSFTIKYLPFDANTLDAINIQYMDERTWTLNQVFCALPDAKVTSDESPTQLWRGITNRTQAFNEGIFMVAGNRYRRIYPNWRNELDGRVCLRGDLVKVSHWIADWGTSSDVLSLVQHGDGDVLKLSEPLDDPAQDHLIMLSTPDGRVWGPVEFTVIDDGSTTRRAQVKLQDVADAGGKYAGLQPRDWDLWSGDGLQKERPRAIVGHGNKMAQDAIITSMKPENGVTTSISTFLDDPRVHTAEDQGPPAETGVPGGDEDDDLTITGLKVREVSQAGGDVNLTKMVVVVKGAHRAKWFEAKWRRAGATHFETPRKNLARHFHFESTVTSLVIQVRAKGKKGFGPWFDTSTSGDDALVGLGGDGYVNLVGSGGNTVVGGVS